MGVKVITEVTVVEEWGEFGDWEMKDRRVVVKLDVVEERDGGSMGMMRDGFYAEVSRVLYTPRQDKVATTEWETGLAMLAAPWAAQS